MADRLRHYTIQITVEGPLFIGSGRSIAKKEYLFDPRKRQVSIPDMGKLCQFLREKRLTEAFESYMLNGKEDLSAWFCARNIFPQECRPWIAYTMDSGDAVFENRGKKEIATFMKDAYGCPYVPGSSLKGALRTVLLAADILRQPQKFQRSRQAILSAPVSGKRWELQREIGELEQRAFYTLNRDERNRRNAVNDTLSGFRIGDSEPVSVEDLVLCQKIDVLPDGQQRRLPILRECLKPGTELYFPLTIDTGLCPVTPEQLLHGTTKFIENYEQEFLRAFPMDEIRGGGNLYLGGGIGFASKTVMYPLLGGEGVRRTSEILSGQFRNHKHAQDPRRGVSPHTVKCTMYRGELYEMGACTIEIR